MRLIAEPQQARLHTGRVHEYSTVQVVCIICLVSGIEIGAPSTLVAGRTLRGRIEQDSGDAARARYRFHCRIAAARTRGLELQGALRYNEAQEREQSRCR